LKTIANHRKPCDHRCTTNDDLIKRNTFCSLGPSCHQRSKHGRYCRVTDNRYYLTLNTRATGFASYLQQFFLFLKSDHPIPWRDSILPPTAPVSTVAGGDDSSSPCHQGAINCSWLMRINNFLTWRGHCFLYNKIAILCLSMWCCESISVCYRLLRRLASIESNIKLVSRKQFRRSRRQCRKERTH
jgi:hypothetical protein